ncbi:MAG: LPS export ABC transporter periplasmic protein LptC, partial [Candidatus Cloacimonetes bacterium]|nr:LPS export ABC transporter periplasmic protein LptC [Candidatus Cloacimonadota bacterium]
HVEYQRLQEELHLWGNVFVRELHKDNTIRTFAAQKVFYFRDRREFQAEEEVEVYDERESIRGRCGILRYFLDSEYGYLLMEPVIRLEDKDSLQVAAQKIEYFRSFQKVVANFAVEVATEEFLIQSDFLLYFADEDKAIFLGNPRFLSEFADANAREFQIFFQERQIRQAELHDSCRVDFKAEETQEKESWIVADDMVFDFQDNMLTLCRASGAVDSYYIQDYTPEREYSVNKAQGTHLILSVADNRITRIDMSTEVKGMYKFRKKD